MNVIKLAVFPIGEADDPPKRCLAIPYVLTLPLDHIQDMQNAVLGPILVKNAIQDCVLRKYRRKGRQ